MSSSRKNRDDRSNKPNDRSNKASDRSDKPNDRGGKPRKKRPRGNSSKSVGSVGLPWPVVVAAACGMLAAWVAAGSTGLLVTPLRHVLAGLLLGVTVVALRPAWRRLIFVTMAAALGVVASLLTGGLAAVDSLSVALVLAVLVFGSTGPRRRALLLVATAAGGLAVFRAASFAVPTVWSIDQMVGHGMGWLGGLFSDESLDVGSSLGGLDLLLVMIVFYVGWLRATPKPRLARALYAAAAIVAVHVLYLIVLSHATRLAAALPEPPMPESFDPGRYKPVGWNLLAGFRAWLPWNLPLLAAVAQSAVAMAMLRWTRIESREEQGTVTKDVKETKATKDAMPTLRLGQGNRSSDEDNLKGGTGETPVQSTAASKGRDTQNNGPKPKQETVPDDDAPERRSARLLLAASVAVALLAGWLTVWSSSGGDLSGKKIVGYGGGYERWITPTHEALDPGQSANFYGLLPSLVADLGGQWSVSKELTKDDLKGADVLVVIHPLEHWPEERTEQVEQFVREGGSLLVVAGPMIEQEIRQKLDVDPAAAKTPRPGEPLRPVNGLLRFTGMAFRNDLAVSPTESWRASLSGSTHPAVFGVSPRTIGLGLRYSPTIDANWPSRPILIGRWAWSEPGSDAMNHGQSAADAGERWGNLLLAAERPVGQGTVVATSDYWAVTNLGMANGYEWTGRLLRYLAQRPSSPQAMWRQVLGLLGYVALFILVVWRSRPARLVAITLTLAVVFTGAMCHAQAGRLIPERHDPQSPLTRPVAYVDASHLEIGSDRPWSNQGTDGFLLTLARNGYLPLKLQRWDAERLKNAQLLVVIGPARPFSKGQLSEVRKFVEDGGCLVCMIGATEATANRGLLDEFEFEMTPSPSPAISETGEAEPMGQYPKPLGRFWTYYLNAKDYGAGNHLARVWYFHGWPIECTSEHNDWRPLVRNNDGKVTLALQRLIGKGCVVLIGDSGFAFNINHGYFNGQLSDSNQDNADFWRWMLSRVTGQREWIPPDRSRPSPQGAWRQGRREVWR